ncbi:MAG: hypothetical protein NC904_03375 [Candidatus Omnitrophica bacterium]|nr:hypothetical protein [Candidatus Omnitrophota bacterium]
MKPLPFLVFPLVILLILLSIFIVNLKVSIMLRRAKNIEERFTDGMNKLLEDTINYSANLKEDIQSKEEIISQLNRLSYNLSEQVENLKRENYQLKERVAILTKENAISLEKLEALKLASQGESNDNIKV